MMDYRKYIRNIKLELLTNKIHLEVSPPHIGNYFSRLLSGNKIVKELLQCGAILTGSRALKCYQYKGNPVLNRKPDDWDFIVDEDTLFKICDKYKLSHDIKTNSSDDQVLYIKKQLVRFTHSYGGESQILPTNIHLICKDEPSFIQTKFGKIADLSYILDEKYKLTSKYLDSKRGPIIIPTFRYDENKHDLDLKQIITRFNGI